MKNTISQQAFFVAASALVCLAGEPLAIPWYTIDGGGVMHSADEDEDFFVFSGTIGQPDAGVMGGGDFKLSGGFWFETPPGDCDGNGIRDLVDHDEFVDCLSGPAEGADKACSCFDTSRDEHVDLRDFAETQREYFSE